MSAAVSAPGAAGIVGVNAAVVLGAILSGDGPLMLMFPYWMQSVIIGGFNVRRIAALEVFTTDGLKINGRAVDPTPSTRRQTWVFFLVHYGFFHFIYLMFMGAFSAMGRSGAGVGAMGDGLGALSSVWLLVTAAGFLVSEGQEHLRERAEDVRRPPNIGRLMFAPYVRIVPMHLTIIFGALLGGWFATLLFGALKTLVELAVNAYLHGAARRALADEAAPAA